jgi:hypothetical protein
MAGLPVFEAGAYRYIKAVFQYSGGVVAQPGYEIERARFATPLPLAEAYAAVESHLKALGRPVTAFAACELRSPEPFTDQGFTEFNRVYVKTLERWGIYKGGDSPVNPVARTNVCPVYDRPAEPVMYGFSYTVPAKDGNAPRATFIVSGSGDARADGTTYSDRVIRYQDTSPEGDGRPRRLRSRPALALRAAAGRRSRVRDGRARAGARPRHLKRYFGGAGNCAYGPFGSCPGGT